MVTLLATERGYTVVWSKLGNGQRGNSFYLDDGQDESRFFSGHERSLLALVLLRQRYKAKRYMGVVRVLVHVKEKM